MIAALLGQWRTRAKELEPYAPAVAEAFRRAAAELEQAQHGGDEGVTLREASEAGGYHIDHLQRLVSAGAIANVGRKGRPRIRRCDIPVKPGHSVLRGEDESRQLGASAVVASAIARSTT